MSTNKGYSKNRNRKIKITKKVVLIATEGDINSERIYFTQLNREISSYRIVHCKDSCTDPVNMANAIVCQWKKDKLNARKGDRSYCIVDSDFNRAKNKQMADAETILSHLENSKLIVSSPCFEVWYIFHFENRKRKYSSKGDIDKVINKYLPKYKKTNNYYYDLKENMITAANNAAKMEKDLLKDGLKRHTVEFIPSSEIYKIFKDLDIY